MTIHFDTLEYSTAPEKAGIERAHAEAIARVQAQALTDLDLRLNQQMVVLRSIQFGGALAAFAVTAVILLMRFGRM